MKITHDTLITAGTTTVTVIHADNGNYTLVSDLSDGGCDEHLIYPSGRVKEFDSITPADAAMSAIADYLTANYA